MPKIAGVNHRDAVRALQKVGFQIAREGKHIVMTNGQRIVTIPRHDPLRPQPPQSRRLARQPAR